MTISISYSDNLVVKKDFSLHTREKCGILGFTNSVGNLILRFLGDIELNHKIIKETMDQLTENLRP